MTWKSRVIRGPTDDGNLTDTNQDWWERVRAKQNKFWTAVVDIDDLHIAIPSSNHSGYKFPPVFLIEIRTPD